MIPAGTVGRDVESACGLKAAKDAKQHPAILDAGAPFTRVDHPGCFQPIKKHFVSKGPAGDG